MSKTADVLQSIWTDPWFLALHTDAKAIYLWAITSEHGNQAGLFVVAEPVICLECGLDAERFERALQQLDGKVVYDRPTGALWVRGKAKRIRMKTTQIAKSVARATRECPHPGIRDDFLAKYGDEPWLKPEILNLARASREVQGKPVPEPESVSLTGTSPEVPSQGLGQGLGQETAPQQETRDAPPADLRADLVPLVVRVKAVLDRIAEAKRDSVSVLPTLASVGRTMASYPDRDHLDVAGDLEQWLVHGTGRNRPARDVVASYRNQLKTAVDSPRRTPPVDRTAERIRQAAEG